MAWPALASSIVPGHASPLSRSILQDIGCAGWVCQAAASATVTSPVGQIAVALKMSPWSVLLVAQTTPAPAARTTRPGAEMAWLLAGEESTRPCDVLLTCAVHSLLKTPSAAAVGLDPGAVAAYDWVPLSLEPWTSTAQMNFMSMLSTIPGAGGGGLFLLGR